MSNEAALAVLQSLAQLDVDASYAYRRAVAGIGIADIRRELTWFWRDHERHLATLAEEIRRLGGEPPAPGRDAKGLALEGYTALRSGMGLIGALRAMRTSALLANTQYEAALGKTLPESARAVVAAGHADGRRHLEYIDYVLATRHDELSRHETRVAGVGASTVVAGLGALLVGFGLFWALRRWAASREPQRAGDVRERAVRRVDGAAQRSAGRSELGAQRARPERERVTPSLP
jgi:hypothetical protein